MTLLNRFGLFESSPAHERTELDRARHSARNAARAIADMRRRAAYDTAQSAVERAARHEYAMQLGARA